MPERSAYVRIADVIRERIASGEYPQDLPIPTRDKLSEEFGVSDWTIKLAIGILKDQGLVETRTRGGTLVRRRKVIRRISYERYCVDFGPQDTPGTSFTADQGISWSDYDLRKAPYEYIGADVRLAGLFEVEPDTLLLKRHFIFEARGEPKQMSWTYYLASDVEGTPIEDPAREPWPGGTVAQLQSIGIWVDDITELVTAGMPDEYETDTLKLMRGVPVFRLTRHMYSRGRVVEVADPIVMPCDATELFYRIPLPARS